MFLELQIEIVIELDQTENINSTAQGVNMSSIISRRKNLLKLQLLPALSFINNTYSLLRDQPLVFNECNIIIKMFLSYTDYPQLLIVKFGQIEL